MNRSLHKVTCKIALFSPEKDRVLVVEYGQNEFGLPGGHLEEGETPEAAIVRELSEELGVSYKGTLKRADFWRHVEGKIILGFTGELLESDRLQINTNEIRNVKWTNISDIREGRVNNGTYNKFILKFSSAR